jgi:hypothetical protein
MKYVCLFVLLSVSFLSYSQDSIPVLKGRVTISITRGTIDCDLSLHNIPPVGDYYIRINSGMNIRNFRNLADDNLIYYDRSFNDTMSSGESIAYYFSGNGGKGKFLPKDLAFKYVGAYPVITDTIREYSVEDWKGNIAFNGYSVRADGRQSAWYPVLYDIKRDIPYDKVKYEIDVNCSDCNVIYVNGNVPVQGQSAHLTSEMPQQLTIYCGNYKMANVDGTYFLNPDISEQQIRQFGTAVNSFKAYFEKNIGIPYKEKITFIQTTPTSKNNAWMFVSYPSIVNIGYGQYGMKGFFGKDGSSFSPFIAHELAHYYFGSIRNMNAELGDMMSEGFAEYLSMKVAQRLVHDSLYQQKLNQKIGRLKKFDALSIAKVRSKSDYRNRELYVYSYAPLIFCAIEKEIGEPAMWKWLRALIETPTEFTNYSFLTKTLSASIQDDQKTERIKEKYFVSDSALANAIATLGK